tara:strand:- start:555 stop:908 length:354 start_codon:yes stop_codon:yes gene_type:complete
MAIVNDGNQKFGVSESTLSGLVVESFTLTKNSTRVDLNDQNGEPSGTVIAPARTEVTATVQIGAATTLPAIGAEVSISSGYESSGEEGTMIVTSVEKTETQADYQRLTLGGYLKIGD